MPEQLRVPNVVVTGGRDFADGDRIEADLRALLPLGLRRVAQGGNGIDKQLGQAEVPTRIVSADALAWLATHRLHLEEASYRVDARLDGRWPVCGPRRNQRMLTAEKPALVLAYPTRASKGTWSCIVEACRLGIPVLVWVGWTRGAAAVVLDALYARGIGRGVAVILGGGHRALVGDPNIAAMLPQELCR